MWSATFSAPAPSRPGITTAISWPGAKACVTRRASVLAMPLIMGSTRHVRIRKECDSYLFSSAGASQPTWDLARYPVRSGLPPAVGPDASFPLRRRNISCLRSTPP